jgi:hypothetical protein
VSKLTLRLIGIGLAAASMGFTSSELASASAPTVARAVIWPNFSITVSPKSVKRGTVVFKIKNRDDVGSHKFVINGVVSRDIKPHTIVALTVNFKKPGVYFFTLADPDPQSQVGSKKIGGALTVT